MGHMNDLIRDMRKKGSYKAVRAALERAAEEMKDEFRFQKPEKYAKLKKMNEARREAERFIRKLDAAIDRLVADDVIHCKETAAAKRASMDLTRALVELRR